MSSLPRRMQRANGRRISAKARAGKYPSFGSRLGVKKREAREPLKKGTGGINPCFKPANEATKADLVEFHREDMKLRRALYHRNPFAIGGAR